MSIYQFRVGNMKITGNVYALDSTKGNYAYIILGEEIILVDTGRPGQGKGILKDLESMNIKLQDIKHILITHHDIDHIGNLALLEKKTGASIWASEKDIPYIYGIKNREGIKRFIPLVMKIEKPENVNPYPEEQKLKDIEIISTPGHTPGHVCLLYKDIMFVGDLIMTSKGRIKPMTSFRNLSFLNWDTSISRESVKKVDELAFKWICPAHGDPAERNGKWDI